MIGHQRRDIEDNVARNFGMASPAVIARLGGLMDHADRFGMPILTLLIPRRSAPASRSLGWRAALIALNLGNSRLKCPTQ